MGCSLPGSSVHGIFQARVLEWVAIAFSEVTSTLLQNTNYKKRMLTLFPLGLSDLGRCHIPEAWAGLGPLDGLSWG